MIRNLLVRSANARLSDPTPLSDLERERIFAQMNSYLGLLSHTQSYRLRSKMVGILDSGFWQYFDIMEDIEKIVLHK